MQYSRSGEYKLPGPVYRRCGNGVLRTVRWVPSWVGRQFVSGRSHYQLAGAIEVGDHQGLSINKLAAMRLPPDLRGKSVIDVGCSEGFFSRECARRGAEHVVGVDSNLGRLMVASFAARQEGLKIEYRVGVFPNLGVPDLFDYVLCLSVLHHSLSKKDVWKVLACDEFAEDASILRQQLRLLRSLTADNGTCIVEMPYEYDDPVEERQVVDFDVLNDEMKAAGFATSRCLGTWEYNSKHREFKDRMIYVAEVR
jgi:SAM-dependent methyltransferase